MSACMSGTRGSGVLSSTGDVLVRGVGGVCDMCMCLARGGVGGEGGDWMRELGLGFANPVGTGGVLDMCLCFGCGGVGGEWVGGLDQGRERWGGHMVTTSIRHKHQQTTDNTKHHTQNSNWVYNRHKHTTSTRRNTFSTHKGTPATTRITDKTNITTLTPTTLNPHTHYTTSQHNKQTTYNNTDYTTNIDTNTIVLEGLF